MRWRSRRGSRRPGRARHAKLRLELQLNPGHLIRADQPGGRELPVGRMIRHSCECHRSRRLDGDREKKLELLTSAPRATWWRRFWGPSVTILDGSVVSVALPSIQRSLGGGLAGQQWVSNAYLLTLCSLILLGGSLGRVFWERRVFAVGVGGFGAASLLCALAPSIGLLIAFRAVQGVARARC